MIEFALVLRDGTRASGSLATVLATCGDGTLLDLANLRQEWRPGVVAHLAALTCVLPRYAGRLTTAEAWQAALDQLLPAAAPGQWCFHPDGTDAKGCSLADAGPGFLGQGHAVKAAWEATPETWALATMGGLHRPLTGGGKVSPWQGGAYVLTGDGSLASEVLTLARAWDAAFVPGRQTGDHFPGWLVPVADVSPIPVPCLWHQRPVRSASGGSGALEQVRLPRTVADGLLPSLPHAAWRNDPDGHRPLSIRYAAPVGGKPRGWAWSPRTHLALLAGKEVHAPAKRGQSARQLRYTVERPAILDAAGPVLRLYGFGTDNGKVEACYVVLSGEGVVGLRRRPLAKAAADTVTAWLEAVETSVGDSRLVEAHGGFDAAARVIDLCALPRAAWNALLLPWAADVFGRALQARLASLSGLARARARLACESRWAGAQARLTAGD